VYSVCILYDIHNTRHAVHVMSADRQRRGFVRRVKSKKGAGGPPSHIPKFFQKIQSEKNIIKKFYGKFEVKKEKVFCFMFSLYKGLGFLNFIC
jgi:hypothetical protein